MRYQEIVEFLAQSGYLVAPSYSNLFVKVEDEKLATTLIYVNVMIITGDDINERCRIRANLSMQF